jgi:PP-loop superfamily ATP-utilizing enzyme
MKITEEQIREISKKIGAKYRNITHQMFQNGQLASEEYLKKLREEEKAEMDAEITKLKAK